MSAVSVVLRVQGLALRGGPRTLLDGLSLEVRPGQVWVLLGPNGSGKSTLLHALAGIAPPAAGRIELQGQLLAQWPALETARLRGLLPQVQHDSFAASVRETVLVGRHPHLARWAWEGDGDEAWVSTALAAVDLAGFEPREVLTLSGGERQRVAMAALLAQDPLLLLLDEPLAHLDLHHQLLLLAHLKRLAVDRGKAIVLSLHDLNLALRCASHAIVLGLAGAGHRAGPAAEVLTTDVLAEAFGHRLQRVSAGGQTLFVPE